MSYPPSPQMPPTGGYPTPQGSPSGYVPVPMPPQGVYPSYPVPAQAPIGAPTSSFWQRLGIGGQGALVVGLASAILFFLPFWFTTADVSAVSNVFVFVSNKKGIPPTVTHSGLNTAIGFPLYDQTSSLTLFPHLWLVLLCAGGLLLVAWLTSQGRFAPRAANFTILATSLLMVLVELGFLIQVNSSQADFERSFQGQDTPAVIPVAFSVSWGFWLAVVLGLAGIAAAAYALLQQKPSPAPAMVPQGVPAPSYYAPPAPPPNQPGPYQYPGQQ